MVKLNEYYEKYRIIIEKLNKEIIKETNSHSPVVNLAVKEMVTAGGKRIRPLLLIMSGKFGDYDENKLFKVATGMEILHMATLVHDDIIDNSTIRRNQITIQQKYGKEMAIFIGDFLINRSFAVFCRFLPREALNRLNQTTKLICESEIKQYQNRNNWKINLRDYLRRIRRKTAVLFGFATYLGGLIGGVKNNNLASLHRFGSSLGMFFQIKDDILDFNGFQKKTGKARWRDLETGILTLPLIYLLQGSGNNKIDNLLYKKNRTETDIQEIIRLINKGGFLDKSYELSLKYVRKAGNYLDRLPDKPAKLELEFILEQMKDRDE